MKVGGVIEKLNSYKYRIQLIDIAGQEVYFEVYGIDQITSDIETINFEGVICLFRNVSLEEIKRPAGSVDILIGYENMQDSIHNRHKVQITYYYSKSDLENVLAEVIHC